MAITQNADGGGGSYYYTPPRATYTQPTYTRTAAQTATQSSGTSAYDERRAAYEEELRRRRAAAEAAQRAAQQAAYAQQAYVQKMMEQQAAQRLAEQQAAAKKAAGQLGGNKAQSTSAVGLDRKMGAAAPNGGEPIKFWDLLTKGNGGQDTWVDWYKRNFGDNQFIPYSSSMYGSWNPKLGLGGNALVNTNRGVKGGSFSDNNNWFYEMFNRPNEGSYKVMGPGDTKRWDEVNAVGGPMGSPFDFSDDAYVAKFIPGYTGPEIPDTSYAPPTLPPPTGGGEYYEQYPEWPDYGGYGGYSYPSSSYSSPTRSPSRYNTQTGNDINKWYANMVQWNINKPK